MTSTVAPKSAVAPLLAKLQCPECRRGALLGEHSDSQLRCGQCGESFPQVEGVPFLFPAREIAHHLEQDRIRPPRWTKKGRGGRYHWSEYKVQELLPGSERAPEVLLLGCGDGAERSFLEELGYSVSTFDIARSRGTDFVADAHRIPLMDGSFDIVLSMQVLEHLHSPWVAVEEIARVLRPGGWFIGSVAFLKAYHASYFHMTHQGVTHLLESNGLTVDRLDGAQSMSYMLYGALLPFGTRRMRRVLYGGVDRVLAASRSVLWSLRTRLSPREPTDRFHAKIPLSFEVFDRLRFAPTVVFRGQKAP